MGFAKSSPELVARFTTLLPKHPDAEPKKMFGYPCCFVRGNFWVGLHEENVALRLPDGLEQRFPALQGAKPFDPMGGRPMRGWFVVPPAVVKDDTAFSALLDATLGAVLKLPPKGAKGAGGAKPSKAKPAGRAPAKTAAPTRAVRKPAPRAALSAKKPARR